MESAVEFAETMRVDRGVYLRRAYVGVSEELLDCAYVRTVLQHVRRGRRSR